MKKDIELFEHVNRIRTIMGINENLILELSGEEIYIQHYSDIDRETFDQIVKHDPSAKKDKVGPYGKWLLKIYKEGNLKMEDLYKGEEYLRLYINNKHHLKGVDLNKINTLPALFKIVQPFYDKTDDLKSNRERKDEIREDVDVVYEDAIWKVSIPRTEEASKMLGKGTQWCTAADNNCMFDDYNEIAPLYVLLNKKTKERYQFHFGGMSQLMDETDSEIEKRIDKIGLTDGIVNFFKSREDKWPFEKIDDNSYVYSTFYSDGTIWTKRTYVDGRLNGPAKNYHLSGDLEMEVFYKDNAMNGEYKRFDFMGHLQKKGVFKSGNKVGVWKDYNNSGTVTLTHHNDKGEIIRKQDTDKNGQLLRDTPYKNGVKDGTQTSYFAGTKKVQKIVDFMQGAKNGSEITYDENGSVISSIPFDTGIKHGEGFLVDANGHKHIVKYKFGYLER